MFNKKILIADDNLVNRELLGDVLERFQTLGVEVLYAVNGVEAFEVVQKEKPALVFLDLMMPDMSGHEVMRKIKADEELKATHIIVVSARTQQEDGKESEAAGADDYITKPYDIRLIRQKVKDFLQKYEARVSGSKPVDSSPSAKTGDL